MIKIDYPAHDFRMKKEKGKELIFDELRKIWVRLTPEEWVRQNFVSYLIHAKRHPSSLVAVEKKVMVGEMIKRFDILVYNSEHQPWMMVECKAADVPLKEDVLAQVLRYNIAVPVEFLVITNGMYCMGFRKTGEALSQIEEIPAWPAAGQ